MAMRKSDILKMFNEGYKHCMDEFKQLLTAISDYETVIAQLELEKKPKIGKEELNRTLDVVSDRGKNFIDCIRYTKNRMES